MIELPNRVLFVRYPPSRREFVFHRRSLPTSLTVREIR
jgi:hypothetical protein